MARGKKRKKLLKRASKLRSKTISFNPWFHKEDRKRGKYNLKKVWNAMPEKLKKYVRQLEKTKKGRQALKTFRKFTGLPYPTRIKFTTLPGPKNKIEPFVVMGTTPLVQIADGPEGKARRIKKIRGRRYAVTTANGDQILILGKPSGESKAKFRRVGYAPETHYIPTKDTEDAGTFKKGKYWIHKHDRSELGKYPEVYQIQGGTFVYAPGGSKTKVAANGKRKKKSALARFFGFNPAYNIPGAKKATYKVTDWIRR